VYEVPREWPRPATPSTYSTQANRAIGPLELLSVRSVDRAVPSIGQGGDLPNGRIPTARN
jgi:hypothetical protein